MELVEYFARRKRERWNAREELRHLQVLVDQLDDGGYPIGKAIDGIVPQTRIRKWAQRRLRTLQERIANTPPAYQVTRGRTGGLTIEERERLQEKRVLHMVRQEIEKTTRRLDQGLHTMDPEEGFFVPANDIKINRTQLARRTGVSPAYISRIMSGQRPGSVRVLSLIAGAWGVSLETAMARIQTEIDATQLRAEGEIDERRSP